MSGYEEKPDNRGGRQVEFHIGVSPDFINAWSHLSPVTELIDSHPDNPALMQFSEKIVRRALSQDIPSYADYLRKKYDAQTAGRILEESRADVVAQLDELASEFNRNRVKIAEESDWPAVHALLERAVQLIQQAK
ncbi:MAG: hypothetical protein V1846_02230 [Candidatus Komeilibacteria bacterium]